MYLGWRHRRVDGEDYDGFVDRFVQAVRAELPHVLLQWEDFATPHALPILERYRDQLLTFNDDIQGTAAVVVGGAVRGRGRHRVTGPGAEGRHARARARPASGSASRSSGRWWPTGCPSRRPGPGSTWSTCAGCSPRSRTDLSPAQRRFAHPAGAVPAPAGTGAPARAARAGQFAEVVAAVRPTALIGLSTATGAFTEEIVREMAAHVPRPIIMPLSNPTSRQRGPAAGPGRLDRTAARWWRPARRSRR